jgi:hypothetical protein
MSDTQARPIEATPQKTFRAHVKMTLSPFAIDDIVSKNRSAKVVSELFSHPLTIGAID